MTQPKKKDDALALFDDDEATSGGKFGPIYHGVCRTIRELVAAGIVDKKRDAGTIAQARSLASSLDRVSGHNAGRQASGIQLAALHAQLDALLERLDPAGGAVDPFQEFLESLDDEGGAHDGRAATPHAEE